MGRRNRRKHQKSVTPIKELQERFLNRPKHFDGRCAYCGCLVYPGTWHVMYDEFGQLVKKCNDERYCSRKRSKRIGQEESFRQAIRYFNCTHSEGKWMEP